MHERTWRSINLWPHQREAVEMIERYLQSRSRGSALIRMPTGTGKTGVIAVTARCLGLNKNVLVVCPYAALRDQLTRDIDTRFFESIGIDPRVWPATVIAVRPSTLGTALDKRSSDVTVFVSTIQALQYLHREDQNNYSLLQRTIGLVMVDEGHREPAPDWAASVRSLHRHTVLLTATPYRNDHHMFSVDAGHIYAFSHKQAVADRYIREVRFQESKLSRDPRSFATELLTFYRSKLSKLKPSAIAKPRVIIRCETRESVSAITRELARLGVSVLGIHDRFDESLDEKKAQQVPDPKEQRQTFWVHQFKLLEGIDEPAFCLVALFDPLRNARSLVQQVGRIIRNPGRQRAQFAYVLCRPEDGQVSFWNGYRAYEQDYEKDPGRSELRQLFDTFLGLQPEYQYYDRDFRRKFDWTKKNLEEGFRYRPSAVVYQTSGKPDLNLLIRELVAEWTANDADIRFQGRPNENTFVGCYITARNSPILRTEALTELSLGFFSLRCNGNFLFFNDSQGRSSTVLRERYPGINPKLLESLYSGKTARISHVSLINTDVGKHNTRRRTIQAFSVADTAPGLLDHVHFASTATGYSTANGNQSRRYVGFSRGRVADRTRIGLNFADYCSWIDSVADELRRAPKAAALFQRYALFSEPPQDPEPRNVLLDIFDVMHEFVDGEKALDIEDVCLDVKDGIFTIPIGSQKFQVAIHYEPDRKQYRLEGREIDDTFEMTGPNGKPESLIHYLNRTQAIRVVIGTVGVIYAHGRFYRPRAPLVGRNTKKDGIELMRILEPLEALGTIGDEKGSKPTLAGWSEGSLFHFIDKCGRGSDLEKEFLDVDLVVCDDLQKEIADFILCSTKRRKIAMVHAKAKPAVLSASQLSEVCSQATKNLSFLSPYIQHPPPNLDLWDKEWTSGRGTVRKRIRVGKGPASRVWEQMLKVLRDPQSTKEVWIILGSTLSKSALEDESRRENPKPEAVQIVFLLQSTWAAVTSAGGRLRIFCSP